LEEYSEWSLSIQKRILNELETNGLTRIYIQEILKRINKKDKRSVITWCRKNNLEIYKDSSGRYVSEAEFNFAYNQPIIKRYKTKYGENWLQMYELTLENKLHLADSENERVTVSKRYIPKSKESSNFLKRI
jgi:hypothetical protein